MFPVMGTGTPSHMCIAPSAHSIIKPVEGEGETTFPFAFAVKTRLLFHYTSNAVFVACGGVEWLPGLGIRGLCSMTGAKKVW